LRFLRGFVSTTPKGRPRFFGGGGASSLLLVIGVLRKMKCTALRVAGAAS
jgi:hypothetical protein